MTSNSILEKDGRGCRGHHTWMFKKIMEGIVYIKTFQTVPSHDCKQGTNCKFLQSNLSFSEVYQLYLTECEQSNLELVDTGMWFVMNSVMVSISKRKIPVHAVCEWFKHPNDAEKDAMSNQKDKHSWHKIEARTLRMSTSSWQLVINLFMQHVLTLTGLAMSMWL